MEGNLQNSPKLVHSLDGDDSECVSTLSTILVASIQEARDRISQIEYIFCSQLYPNFQSKSKCLERVYSTARKDAEESWQAKEKDLLLQIQNLQAEKQLALEENQSLKLEMEKKCEEMSDNRMLVKVRSQQFRIDELEQELLQRSKEIEDGLELQRNLFQLVQSKASMIDDKVQQLKEQEEKENKLLAKSKDLEQEVEELQKELREVAERKQHLEEQSAKEIERLGTEVADSSKLIVRHETEKKEVVSEMEYLQGCVSVLDKKLGEKTAEAMEEKALRAELVKQIDIKAAEITKQKQDIELLKNDKQMLLEKADALEKKLVGLQEVHNGCSNVVEGAVTHQQLIKQLESKASELLAEKRKTKDLLDKYKNLMSQHKYLRSKVGLSMENMIHQTKAEDETSLPKDQENLTTSTNNKDIGSIKAGSEANKVKMENEFVDRLEDDQMVRSNPVSRVQYPTTHNARRHSPTAKYVPINGTKRRASSSWVDTRSRQSKDGLDPHDDFLDTPIENLRGNLNKALKEEVDNVSIPAQADADPNSSDEETQDMNVNRSSEDRQMRVPLDANKGFKCVQTVRKKAERENLPGYECKRCEKFFNAVIPKNGEKAADRNKQNFRCEHHQGVSRHRSKYFPPLTPEGFWNIGFESEM